MAEAPQRGKKRKNNEDVFIPVVNQPCGIWIWGEPQSGKTQLAHRLCQQAGHMIWNKCCNDTWFDGYVPGYAIVMDDWDPTVHDWVFPYLKQWGGSTPWRAQLKGSSMVMRPPMFIIVGKENPLETPQGKALETEISTRWLMIECKKGNKPPVVTERLSPIEPDLEYDQEQLAKKIVDSHANKRPKKDDPPKKG